MKPPAIFIAPTPTSLGWPSMNRYRQALAAEMPSGSKRPHFLWPDGPVEAPASGRFISWFHRQVVYPRVIRAEVPAGAVLHVLDHSFAELLAHVRPGVCTVVTLHDLIPLDSPGDLRPSQLARFRRRVAHLHQADAVVCVSEFTRQAALRLLALPEAKLHVIHNGASPLPAPDSAMQQRLAKLPPYVLSVGGTSARKNLQSLPSMMESLTKCGSSAVLVRAGPLLDPELAAEIRRHAQLVELGPVSDAGLSAAYASAAVTIVPSLLEGFGLPVLEAMRAGCPVVHARSSSLPEVAGGAALDYDPTEPAEAAARIHHLLHDAELRQRLIQLGHERAGELTWRAHWEGLTRLYARLADT